MLDRIAVSERILVHLIDDLISFSRLESGDVIIGSPRLGREGDRADRRGAVAAGARAARRAAPRGLVRRRGQRRRGEAAAGPGQSRGERDQVFAAGSDGHTALPGRSDAVSFDVVDDGPGIPPEKLADIFEPYVRLDPASSPGTAGWGRAWRSAASSRRACTVAHRDERSGARLRIHAASAARVERRDEEHGEGRCLQGCRIAWRHDESLDRRGDSARHVDAGVTNDRRA